MFALASKHKTAILPIYIKLYKSPGVNKMTAVYMIRKIRKSIRITND